jgi:hypothetical protein
MGGMASAAAISAGTCGDGWLVAVAGGGRLAGVCCAARRFGLAVLTTTSGIGTAPPASGPWDRDGSEAAGGFVAPWPRPVIGRSTVAANAAASGHAAPVRRRARADMMDHLHVGSRMGANGKGERAGECRVAERGQPIRSNAKEGADQPAEKSVAGGPR